MSFVEVVVGVQHRLKIALVQKLPRRKAALLTNDLGEVGATLHGGSLVSSKIKLLFAFGDGAFRIAQEFALRGGVVLLNLTRVGEHH